MDQLGAVGRVGKALTGGRNLKPLDRDLPRNESNTHRLYPSPTFLRRRRNELRDWISLPT